MDESTQEWTASFSVITYRDIQAITDPTYKARGRRVHGPFASYGDASLYAEQMNCTHYNIEKIMVKPGIHPPFLNFNGDRLQEELFDQEYPTS